VIPAAVFAAWVAFIDAPAAAREVASLRLAALRTAVTRGLVPGTFRDLGDGATLHFRELQADGALRDVFIHRQLAGPAARMQVIVAARARYDIPGEGRAILVELEDGESYEGRPGALDWRLTQFRRQHIRLPVPEATLPGKPRVDVLDNRALLGSPEPRLQGELHWRIGWVAAVLVLGFMAVPLSRLAPRQGRHARIPLAVLLFGVYAGFLTSGRTLLERGETPLVLGLWWVHAAVLLLAWLIVRRTGLRRHKARPRH
jgi:lipopolysaccharide export system permease protein